MMADEILRLPKASSPGGPKPLKQVEALCDFSS